ncbi:hypothetical protein [Streptococcus thoraltensis]|uniref:hypothetical protein n=1 Tax=Streptococcus thoraltensis TaxID=55085 RepID=UPI00035DD87E|nr:hypothetical protein [Streptococcus thoraltensis]QBX31134.1 hypothetical protein Javan616_0041 [Streptococcus phage Javan616]
MTQQLFEDYHRIIKKHYGRTATQETFNKFVEYTKKGEVVDGVKPIMNPINLYAHGIGITSKEATDILFERVLSNDRN